MKQIYGLLLLLFIITGCQQQQVPEVFYDLDAQSLINQTRAMQELILYQAPLETIIDKELQVFHGRVVNIDAPSSDSPAIVQIENEMEVILEFEVEQAVADLMTPEMHLAVRYMREQKKINVVEIKKALW
ncbi:MULTISPECIES: hypothetical protein [unclassified Aureispira]|uniref:hypothetical protein n=1 Tax=unclassified Aureispira TaxID=2649989 RepID=UPI000696E5E6|nr:MULTISPECIES: hypothetical protein [unclassified Aureispira]WMX14964.1 hypothetical protein QP953_01110 [Aureispira sp. CCB-E]